MSQLRYNGKIIKSSPNYEYILRDGHTVAWYDYTDLTTLILTDASVSRWNDKLGSGHDLIQVNGSFMPILTSSGILFDGVNDYLAGGFSYEQPEMIYIVIKKVSYTTDHSFLLDGSSGSSGQIRYGPMAGSPTEIRSYAGAFSSYIETTSDNNYGILKCLFNGTQSKLQFNTTSPWIGNTGTSDMNGFTIACFGGKNLGWSNIEVKEIILRNNVDSASQELEIYNYLYQKHFSAPIKTGSLFLKVPSYEPETLNLIARMDVPPSNSLKWLINKTIKDLKDAGIFYNYADCLYFANLHTQQASSLNWIRNAYNLSLTGAVSWIEKIGFLHTNQGQAINTSFVPSTDASNYSLNDFGVMFVDWQNISTAALRIAGTPSLDLYMNDAGNINFRGRSHTVSRTSYSASLGITTEGMISFERTSSSSISFYKNGILVLGPLSYNVDATLPSSQIIYNTNGGVTVSLGFRNGYIGKSLQDKNLTLWNIINNFNENVKYAF